MDFEKWYARIEPSLKERADRSNGELAIDTIYAIISKYYGGDPRTKRHAVDRLKENGKIRINPKNPKFSFIFLDGHDAILETKEQVEAKLQILSGRVKA